MKLLDIILAMLKAVSEGKATKTERVETDYGTIVYIPDGKWSA